MVQLPYETCVCLAHPYRSKRYSEGRFRKIWTLDREVRSHLPNGINFLGRSVRRQALEILIGTGRPRTSDLGQDIQRPGIETLKNNRIPSINVRWPGGYCQNSRFPSFIFVDAHQAYQDRLDARRVIPGEAIHPIAHRPGNKSTGESGTELNKSADGQPRFMSGYFSSKI